MFIKLLNTKCNAKSDCQTIILILQTGLADTVILQKKREATIVTGHQSPGIYIGIN